MHMYPYIPTYQNKIRKPTNLVLQASFSQKKSASALVVLSL